MHDHRDLMNVQRADAFVGADASLPGALDYRFLPDPSPERTRKLDVQRRMKLIDRLLDKCFRRHGALVLIVTGLLCLQITTSDSTPLEDSNSSSGSISSSGKYSFR
uniref:Uncharacterized protein n=1 Tax=Anopheles merus TaxID=30066 RepID=A0A182URN2_ANOME